MFKKNKLGILEWFILILVMSIPIVNIIFLIWGILKNKFSENLKNFGVAYVLFIILIGGGLFNFL